MESRYMQIAKQNSAVAQYASRFRGSPRTRTEENTTTCTARQVLQATAKPKFGGRLVIDNKQIYTVRLCGRITEINQNENATDFTIDDGTGRLDGRIWALSNNGKTGLSGATLGAYYVVIANVVTFSTGILLQTLKADPVTDHNQITLHLISAIHEHCTSSALRNEEVVHWDNAEKEAKKDINRTLRLELDKEAIVSFLSNTSIRESEYGANSKSIIEATNMDDEEAWRTLKAMLDEGSVYNTVDYQHFKLADEN